MTKKILRTRTITPAPEEVNEPVQDTNEVVETPEVEQQQEEVAETEGTSDDVLVTYIHPLYGQTGRVFSLQDHGKDFRKLAKSFADNNKGYIEK